MEIRQLEQVIGFAKFQRQRFMLVCSSCKISVGFFLLSLLCMQPIELQPNNTKSAHPFAFNVWTLTQSCLNIGYRFLVPCKSRPTHSHASPIRRVQKLILIDIVNITFPHFCHYINITSNCSLPGDCLSERKTKTMRLDAFRLLFIAFGCLFMRTNARHCINIYLNEILWKYLKWRKCKHLTWIFRSFFDSFYAYFLRNK